MWKRLFADRLCFRHLIAYSDLKIETEIRKTFLFGQAPQRNGLLEVAFIGQD